MTDRRRCPRPCNRQCVESPWRVSVKCFSTKGRIPTLLVVAPVLRVAKRCLNASHRGSGGSSRPPFIMPVKTPATKRKSKSAPPEYDSGDNDNTVVLPTWDTADNTMPAYFYELMRVAPEVLAEHLTLIETGTVLERGKIYCVSDNHVDTSRRA